LVSEGGEIVLPGNGGCGGAGMGEGRGVHEFEILFVLRGGAGGKFVEPIAQVGAAHFLKFIEGVEEVVVRGDAGGWDEAAHGEGVNQGVVESLVFEGLAGGDFAFGADGFGRGGGGERLRLAEGQSGGVDAQVIFDGFGDEGFRVDGTGDVDVEVGALGHFEEPGVESDGRRSGDLQAAVDAVLGEGAGGGDGFWFWGLGLGST